MYAIYREDAKCHQISIHSTYTTYVEAHFHLNRAVSEYLESKGQSESRFIKKRKDLLDNSIDLGYYVKPSNRCPNRFHVFQKSTRVTQGYLWNGQNQVVDKLLWFGILELNCSSGVVEEATEITKRYVSQTLQQHGGQVKVLDELKQVLARYHRTYDVDSEGNLSSPVVKKPAPTAFAQELVAYVEARKKQQINLREASDDIHFSDIDDNETSSSESETTANERSE